MIRKFVACILCIASIFLNCNLITFAEEINNINYDEITYDFLDPDEVKIVDYSQEIQLFSSSVTSYSQTDSRWGSHSYGKGPGGKKATIASSGCALLSLTNAIYHLNGEFINPTTLADFSVSKGYRVNGKGTAHSFFKGAAEEYGDKYGFKYVKSTTNIDTLKDHLKNGGVATCIQPGHFMAISKYDTSTKKYLLLDSYRSSKRGTSSGYAWKTSKQLSSSLGITKYFLLNPAKLHAPTIKTCAATSDSAIKITWNDVAGAEKYQIVRTENEGANKKVISNIKGTSYTDTGLKSGTTYYYTVYAVNGSKTSKASDHYKTYTKPKAPDKPEVSRDSTSQLTISWNKVSGATKYQVIYHKAGSDEWKTLKDNIDGTSYVHKNLAAGQKYYYRVIAKRIGNIGPEGNKTQQVVSSAQSGTKTKFTNIKEPSHEPYADNDAYVSLKWDAVKGDNSYTYVYKVLRDGKEISSYLTAANYIDKTASPDRIHKYQIKAYEKGTDYTYRTSSDVFYAGAKLTPEIVAVPESNKTIKISWQTPKSAPSGVQYEIKRKLPSDTEYITVKKTTATTYTDTNLTTGTTYQYYVRVLDNNGKYITRITGKKLKLDIVPSAVLLNKTILTLVEGETTTLTATITPNNSFNKSVTWSSSNATIASVNSSGIVTAKKEGTVDIIAKTSNGLTTKCTITVQSAKCSHLFGEWIVDTDATCETDGSKHRICSECNETEVEIIKSTGHSFPVEMEVLIEATCSTEGEKAFVCENCSQQKDNTVMEKTSHSFGDWTREAVTDCTTEGIEIRTCEVCLETETRTTEPKDHSYKLIAETKPTLDGPGTKQYLCEACQETHIEQWVNVVSEGIVYVGGTAPNAGETVSIPVSIIENPGIAGFTFKVKYDKSVLTPKEITSGDLTANGLFTSNLEQGIPASELDEVIVHWNSNENATGDGILFNVVFEVNSAAIDGQYGIWLEYENGDITNQNLDDVLPTVLANVINIADVIRGDVNLDRSVDQMDGILLARFNGGWRLNFTDKQKQAADVYLDSKINSKDGVRLSQLLIGYENLTNSTEEIFLSSASNAKISIESTEACAGDIIYVPVAISENTGIAGFDLKINYDSSQLTPISVEQGDILTDGDFSTSLDEGAEINDGFITASWSNANNMTEDGTLFFVEFMINDTAEVGQKLSVTLDNDYVLCDQNLNDISLTSQSSNIDIIEWVEEYETLDNMSYYINDVTMLQNGINVEDIPQNGDFDLKIDIENVHQDIADGEIAIALYDDNNSLINLQSVGITEEIISNGYSLNHIDKTDRTIYSVKVLIWDKHTLTPLALPSEL